MLSKLYEYADEESQRRSELFVSVAWRHWILFAFFERNMVENLSSIMRIKA